MHHDPITMQHSAHLFGAQKDIIAAIFIDQKPETIGVRGDSAANQIRLVHRQKPATPIAHQLAVAHHCPEPTAERFVFVVTFVDFEHTGHLLVCERLSGPYQFFEDELAAGNFKCVFLRRGYFWLLTAFFSFIFFLILRAISRPRCRFFLLFRH